MRHHESDAPVTNPANKSLYSGRLNTFLLVVSLILVTTNLIVIGAALYVYSERATLQQLLGDLIIREITESFSHPALLDEVTAPVLHIDETVIIEASLPINQTVGIPISTSLPVQVTMPMELSIPILSTFEVPISTSLPINTVLQVPVELPVIGVVEATADIVAEIPIDVILQIPVEAMIDIETDIPINTNIPIETNVQVALDTQLQIDTSVPVSVSIPVDPEIMRQILRGFTE